MTGSIVERSRRLWLLMAARPLLSVLLVALVVRLFVVFVLNVTHGGQLFPSDHSNARLAAKLARGDMADWTQWQRNVYRNAFGYLRPLSWLYLAFGVRPVVGQVFAASLGAATAGLAVMIARLVLPAVWALVAGLVVALHPSQVLWSSLTLKDALAWSLAAAIALLVCWGAKQNDGLRLGMALAGVAAALWWLGAVRMQSFLVAMLALPVAGWAGRPRLRWARGMGYSLVAVLVPLVLGLGPLAVGVLQDGMDRADRYRSTLREGVDDASAERIRDGIRAEGRQRPQGAAPPRLPERVAEGASLTLLEPYPWQPTGGPLDAARVEAIPWYALLALAVVGLLGLLRSTPVRFVGVYGAGLVAVYALTESNLGTAYRHRSELVWVVAVLAALGARALWERHAAGRREARSE